MNRCCTVASSESEEEKQVVSVHQAPSHSVFEGRVAMPVRQISSRVPKRLRLTGHQHGAVPTDDVCEGLEFDLTLGDSDAPPPLPPPNLPPAISFAHPNRFGHGRPGDCVGQAEFSTSKSVAGSLV